MQEEIKQKDRGCIYVAGGIEPKEIKQKGRACIYVAGDVEPEGIKRPAYGQVGFEGWVEVEKMLSLWKKHLLLPERYAIIGAFFAPLQQQWVLIVESEEIPQPSENDILATLPIIQPVYQVTFNAETGERAVKFVDIHKYM